MVTGSHNPKDYNGFKFVLDNLPFYGEDLKELAKEARSFSISNIIGKKFKFNFQTEYITNLFKNFSKKKKINILIPFLKNDKKNEDEKINFILIKKIGKTTEPYKFKISVKDLKKYSKTMAQ